MFAFHCLTPLSMTGSRSIHDATNGIIPFFLMAEQYSIVYMHSSSLSSSLSVLFFFFLLFRATPTAHKSPQGSNQSCSCQPQPQGIWATSETYTTAHGNAKSLTHWAGPGIEPTTSQSLVEFIPTEPQWELPLCQCFCVVLSNTRNKTTGWVSGWSLFYRRSNWALGRPGNLPKIPKSPLPPG